jgi:hypothetical protein
MSLSDLASLGSFISGLAVLVSLIFLYFQLREMNQQSRHAERVQQAASRQQRADRIASNGIAVTDPSVAEAMFKALTGAKDITPIQIVQFERLAIAIFASYQDTFYQHLDGLMIDRDFDALVNTATQLASRSGFRVQWKRRRAAQGKEFVEFMDALLARTPIVPDASYDPAAWLSDWAKEEALASSSP